MPEKALSDLRAGNTRSVAGRRLDHDIATERRSSADEQHPRSFVLGCIDSRVPPETVFDAGLGDLLVSRTPGATVDEGVLAAAEYGCVYAGVHLMVVLGHAGCGAVGGACEGLQLGRLTQVLDRIRPAVIEVAGHTAPGSDDEALVDRVVHANVRLQVQRLHDGSDVVRRMLDEGEDVRLLGAVYDLDTGEVTWLGGPSTS